MPCKYKIYGSENLLVKYYIGRVTTRDVLELLDAVEEDPEYVEGMLELDDMRFVTQLDITSDEVTEFAELVKNHGVGRRRLSRKAVVATSAETQQAAAWFCANVKYMPDLEVGVFEGMADAVSFLHPLCISLLPRIEREGIPLH